MAASRKTAGGFKLRTPSKVMLFDDTDYAGLEVEVKLRASLAMLLYFRGIGEDSDLDIYAEGIRRFGDEVLVGWNLIREDGTPVPANGEGMLALEDAALNSLIIRKWVSVISEPSAPLSLASNDGEPSAAGSTNADGS